ncbi:hypothetical protein E8E12_003529 [Didymella heteroderae]|uniref:Uncharacterized protein n=1 Tax=Didymella heteroderae TaxID=1769908 RepID=A0A9P4WM18_9PLEO|nr:hypothetical protein E8E12_003529 [Didymella heteroderae]
MGLLSILPASLSTVETWLTRVFLFFGLIMIGPWAALVVYDLVLYVFRAVTYEIPVVGGRARGKARPRAPSLTERPNGHRRRFSLARPKEDMGSSTGTAKAEAPDARSRATQEGIDSSSGS